MWGILLGTVGLALGGALLVLVSFVSTQRLPLLKHHGVRISLRALGLLLLVVAAFLPVLPLLIRPAS